MNPVVLVLLLGLVFAVLQVYRPVTHRPAGRLVLRAPLPLLARTRLHALPASLGVATAATLVAVGGAPWWVLFTTMGTMALLIAWPVSYVLTTAGIHVGRTGQRRWSEFAGVVRVVGGVRLQGGAGSRSFRVWLSESRGDDEFVHLLRQMIKGAYQGQRGAISPPRDAGNVGDADGASSADGINREPHPVTARGGEMW